METNVRLQICIFCVCVHVCGCAFKYFMVFSIFMKQQEQCVLPALNFSSRNSCKFAFVYVIIAYPAVHVIHCVNLFPMISPCINKSSAEQHIEHCRNPNTLQCEKFQMSLNNRNDTKRQYI